MLGIRRSSPDPPTSRPLISDSRDSAEEEVDKNCNVPCALPGRDTFDKIILGYEDDFSSDEDDMEVTLDN